MVIRRVKKGNSIYLYEYKSYRENGKVKTKFVRYLGVEGDEPKIPKPKKPRYQVLYPQRSKKYGDIALLWWVAEKANFVQIIDKITTGRVTTNGTSPGRLLTAWAINRLLQPESATQLCKWIITTDLPRLMGVKEDSISKDCLLSALDMVCCHDPESDLMIDFTNHIDDALYQFWRSNISFPDPEGETLAYDLTSVLFYGENCPLVEKGYNTRHSRQKQVNYTLFISKKDSYPLAQCIFPGNYSSLTTVNSLLVRIQEMALIPGSIIWDRGNTTTDTINTIEHLKWKIITAIPKRTNEVKDILASTMVPMDMENMVPLKKNGEVYAIQRITQLFSTERKLTICFNPEIANSDRRERNFALKRIKVELDLIQSKCKNNCKLQVIQSKVKKAINGWGIFVEYEIKEDIQGYSLIWSFNQKNIQRASDMDGKALFYATNSALDAEEVIKQYFSKDSIEKVFRCLKSEEELEPVRHLLEQRVRAYFFVCSLAYRLLAALKWFILNAPKNGNTEIIGARELLRSLNRVERCEIEDSERKEIVYLNVLKKISSQIEDMGLDLFHDQTVCST